MEFPRPRDIAKAIGFAAAIGASPVKAEQPTVTKVGIENQTVASVNQKEETPLKSLVEVIKVDPNKVKGDDKVEGFNPNGAHKPAADLVSGVSHEIHLAKIAEAKNVALRLAVDPKSDPEKTSGYIGLKVDL